MQARQRNLLPSLLLLDVSVALTERNEQPVNNWLLFTHPPCRIGSGRESAPLGVDGQQAIRVGAARRARASQLAERRRHFVAGAFCCIMVRVWAVNGGRQT